MLTPADLVEALAALPEHQHPLVALAWELSTPDGELDDVLALAHQAEIEQAAREARAYISAARHLREEVARCLRP